MDHYFIYICHETSISQECFVVDYIRSILPNNESLSNLCTGCLSPPLLECNSVYISVVSSSIREKVLEWKVVKEYSTLKQVITESFKTRDEDCEARIMSEDQILSSHINCLADHLPSLGSFKLDVIISYNVLKDLPMSENTEFAGSLYRLFRWHAAHIAIAAPKGADHSNMKEWMTIIHAEVLEEEMDQTLGTLIWRGSVQFQPSNATTNNFHGFQLRLDFSENEIFLDNPISLSTDAEMTHFEHLILSSNLHVIDECRFSSIPPHLILPFAFRLSVCKSDDNSTKLLQYLNNKNGAALIVRMGYSVAIDKPKPDQCLTTNKWQKMISAGSNITFPEESLPILEKYVSFVITVSITSGKVLAYPLRDPSKINAQLYFTYINGLKCKSQQAIPAEEHSRKHTIELKLPYLTESAFHTLQNKINILKVGMSKKCDNEHSEDSHVCLLSVLESAAKCCACISLFLGENSSEIICEEIDPADWPERVHLLQKQIRIEKEKKNFQPNPLLNLSPQRTLLSVCFASDDAMKYFEPSGEAKDPTKAESISSLRNGTKLLKQDYDKVLQAEWPEVMKYSYDDIYYNSNTHAEELETIGNEMVRFYVQHETACSCNKEQLRVDASIPIRTRHKESAQEWRSPVKQRPLKKVKQGLPTRFIPGRNTTMSSEINNVLSSRPLNKHVTISSNIEKRAKVEKSKKQLLSKTASFPVRHSPRKKVSVKYSNPSTSSSSKVGDKRQDNSQGLPDLSKKKLRVAVASALEKNDLNIDNKFFRPCFKRLFTICQAFVQDLPCKKGRTSEHMQKIADAHVKQVIEFEKQKDTGC